MKILIVSQYFWPENFRINDLALDLLKRGHEVFVLTGKPNYPQGKIYDGYRVMSYTTDLYEGIKIFRVPLIPRGSATGFRLSLNYFSYVLFSCIFILFHRKKFDVTLTFAISPISQAYPAILHKILFKSKACIWVQDLWPESVTAAGKINSQFVMMCLTKMVKHIYKYSDKILVQSEAFIPSIEEKGGTKKQIGYIPNWAEDLFSNTTVVNKEKYQNLMPFGFKIMFTGNIGEAQDFDSILKAVIITKEFKDLKWIIVGDGRKKKWLESEIIRLGLQDTILLLGRFPVEEMPNFFIHADIMLLSLKNEEIYSMTIPSKLQSYLAFGKPVVGMLNGIGAEVIRNANCGEIANASDYNSLANHVVNLYHQEKHFLTLTGENGRRYYNQNFSKENIIDNLLNIFQELTTVNHSNY